MAYRLINIFERFHPSCDSLRIEVCLDGSHKGLAPFQRKVDVDELYRNLQDRSIAIYLQQLGFSKQPFRIEGEALRHPLLVKTVNQNLFNYSQSSSKGGIKRVSSCPLQPQAILYETGEFVGGELYIDDIAQWNKHIAVRFRYANAVNPFFSEYLSWPYRTDDNLFYVRNKDEEEKWVASLGEGYNPECSSYQLAHFDTERLYQLTQWGWKVYIKRTDRPVSRMYSHSSPSGIVWFSTEEGEVTADGNELNDALLNAYLKGRNYIESNGTLKIIRKEDALKENPSELIEDFGTENSLFDLYKNRKSLESAEKVSIDQAVHSRLRATLKSYQWDGVYWLATHRKNGSGCLLADEMGLGKTIQVLAFLLTLSPKQKHLVITPLSIIHNWEREISTFTPSLSHCIEVVSYDNVRIHIDAYKRLSYDTIIIDEAQAIKNKDTQKYQAISELQCNQRVLLTGTPIENSIEEVWNYMVLLNPALRVLYSKLKKSVDSTSSESFIKLSGKLLQPFVLRREKKTVLTELPEKVETILYVNQDEDERKLYDRLHRMVVCALKSGVTARVNSLVLESLLRLRMCCVSPNILPAYLRGGRTYTSSKLYAALDYVEQCCKSGERVLVFSQFVSALDEFSEMLHKKEISYTLLDGSTLNRKGIIDEFKKNESIVVFLLSLKAGGVGLNLTEASHVLFLDDWWNPAVENQAMDRAHRIGQTNQVQVTRLICRNTVEEKILQLQQLKRNQLELFNMSSQRLTLDEIKELLE